MVRTTDADVASIIEVDADVAPTLASFIRPASMLVDEVCAPVETYSEERLKEIETWLAAHFYAQRDPRAQREDVASIGVTFQSKVDLGLNNTHYGQMAMSLDTNGGLAALNEQTTNPDDSNSKNYTAGLFWMGSDE